MAEDNSEVEKNKEIFRQYRLNVMVIHDPARAEEYVSDDCVDHSNPPGWPNGVEGVRRWITLFFGAFPDSELTIDDLFGEGDKVVCHAHFRGTSKGEFMGIPPTGKRFETTGIEIMRFVDGKIAERWFRLDTVRMMQQLGLMPGPQDPAQFGGGAAQGAGGWQQ